MTFVSTRKEEAREGAGSPNPGTGNDVSREGQGGPAAQNDPSKGSPNANPSTVADNQATRGANAPKNKEAKNARNGGA